MPKKKPKRNFNARFDDRVHKAIATIAKAIDTTKTGAVKYAVLTVADGPTVQTQLREKLLREKGDTKR